MSFAVDHREDNHRVFFDNVENPIRETLGQYPPNMRAASHETPSLRIFRRTVNRTADFIDKIDFQSQALQPIPLRGLQDIRFRLWADHHAETHA